MITIIQMTRGGDVWKAGMVGRVVVSRQLVKNLCSLFSWPDHMYYY